MSVAQIRDVRSNKPTLDVTAACQAAIDARAKILFPAGTYLVNADPRFCLKARSDRTLIFEPGAVLQAKGNGLNRYAVLQISDARNVTIVGGIIRGERDFHQSHNGEHGMGVAIYDSANVVLHGVTSRDCWGDGIYVGGTGLHGRSTNIRLDHCICVNNRRQGLTIAAVDGCVVMGGRFIETKGALPASGIDIEPNLTKASGMSRFKAGVTNVILQGVECSGNQGHGITLSQIHTTKVTILDAVSRRNGMSGISCGYPGNDIRIVSPDCKENGENGIRIFGSKSHISRQIYISDPDCQKNGQNGIYFGLNIDGFSIVGGRVSYNGENGIFCDGTGGSVCDNGLIDRVSVHSNSQASDRVFDNIRIGSLCHDFQIRENDVKQGSELRRPRYGLVIHGNEDALVVGNDLRAGGATANAAGLNKSKIISRNNVGLS